MSRIAFVGGGNMAGALIGGLLRAGAEAATIAVLEPSAERRAALVRDFGIAVHAAAGAWLESAKLVVLAVKPQQMREAVRQVAPHGAQATVLSVAAGVRARDIARWLGHGKVIRAMPNTPAMIGAGITGVVALAQVDAAARDLAQRVLEAAGSVLWLDDERQLDPVTAVSGSGPAYVFRFIEALEAAAVARGLPPATARTLAIQTVLGSAQLAATSDEPPAVLRERVTSKGGTTAAALARLDQGDFMGLVAAAVATADQRASELGDEYGRD
jgi:pyrroline-5-carboxylate reductase